MLSRGGRGGDDDSEIMLFSMLSCISCNLQLVYLHLHPTPSWMVYGQVVLNRNGSRTMDFRTSVPTLLADVIIEMNVQFQNQLTLTILKIAIVFNSFDVVITVDC